MNIFSYFNLESPFSSVLVLTLCLLKTKGPDDDSSVTRETFLAQKSMNYGINR